MSEQSSSHKRKVDAYLKQDNHKLVRNYSEQKNISKSAAVNELLRQIPDSLRNQILQTPGKR